MHSRDNNGSQPVNPAGSAFCGLSVGQHVVCINNVLSDPLPGVVLLQPVRSPEVNKVYTIAEVCISELGNQVCITLAEIPRQRVSFMLHGQRMSGWVLFPAKFFRPLQKLKLEDFMPVVEHMADEVRA